MNDAMQKRAKELVVNYFNNRVDKTDKKTITEDDVFIVWFCKTLQNWKALVSLFDQDDLLLGIRNNGVATLRVTIITLYGTAL